MSMSFSMSALCQLDVRLRLSPSHWASAYNLALVTAICLPRATPLISVYVITPPFWVTFDALASDK